MQTDNQVKAVSVEEKAVALAKQIADFKIWDYDRDDGTPYEECEEPDDGHMDSHTALMGMIEAARSILAEVQQ